MAEARGALRRVSRWRGIGGRDRCGRAAVLEPRPARTRQGMAGEGERAMGVPGRAAASGGAFDRPRGDVRSAAPRFGASQAGEPARPVGRGLRAPRDAVPGRRRLAPGELASFEHYCTERLGMAERAVAQRIALERRLYDLPVLREAIRERRISYEKARLIARYAD